MNKTLFGDVELRKPFPRFSWFFGRLVMLAAVWCLASGTALAIENDSDIENGKRGGCTSTAAAALKACQHEVTDNYWIAIGNCNNVSDRNARAECQQQTKTARTAGEEQCGVQFEARLKICGSLGEAPYDPKIDPAKFVDPAKIGKTVAPNPYFPLVRGRTWKYKGGTESSTVTVTEATRKILGVTCATIRDVVKNNGQVIEDTKDWYAQDIYGNVWYFGEIAQKIEDGELVSIDGSWVAGVDRAKAGIIMKLTSKVSEVYRQEFSLGNAEDMAEVLSLTGSATVPATSCSGNCLITKEFLPFDPGATSHKYYARGIGFILEAAPETGERVLELIEVK